LAAILKFVLEKSHIVRDKRNVWLMSSFFGQITNGFHRTFNNYPQETILRLSAFNFAAESLQVIANQCSAPIFK
jgi:hypothetical protein